MRRVIFIGLIAASLGGICPSAAQPRIYTIGLVLADRVNPDGLPPHMRRQHPALVNDMRRGIRGLLADLGRFRTLPFRMSGEGDDPVYLDSRSVDFVIQITLDKADKIYRNQILYSQGLLLYNRPGEAGRSDEAPYEVISLPAITGRLEVRLVDPHKDKVLWSSLRDSTAVVPIDERIFLYNNRKYPGLTHPDLLRAHPDLLRAFQADILRLRQVNRSVDRALNMSDRWFVSQPSHDVEIARNLFRGMVASLAADLDSNLPLEGRIDAMLPAKEGKSYVQLNLGTHHGLRPRMRLEVWRPQPSSQKVGQVEVVEIDSTTAVARLRKLDKKLKKRGEGLQLLDRVISRKRPSVRSF